MSTKPIPSVSLFDNLVFNLCHVIPLVLQGLFVRHRFWVWFFSWAHCDPLMVRFGQRLRRKYRSECVYVRMLFTKSVLVLDTEGAKRVLDKSPLVYGPAAGKVSGMSHFQPNAVTISTGAEWKARRAFNETALAFGDNADHYAAIIASEVSATCNEAGNRLRWQHIDKMFERITLQIIFGKGVKDNSVTIALRKMMRQSNRFLTFRKSYHFDAFDKTIRNALKYPVDKSLLSRCPHANTEITCPQNQVPHWLFAMRDTLAENTARSLVAILSDARVKAEVSDKLAGADLSSASAIQSLRLIENSVQEAMRLWPSTPLITRQTLMSDVVGDAVIPKGVQVLVPNNFLHRDNEAIHDADQFLPERWDASRSNYRFNHLSNGPQVCAGKDLALFIASAVVGNLLQRGFCQLVSANALVASCAALKINVYRVALSRN